jgi:hypothetical protein
VVEPAGHWDVEEGRSPAVRSESIDSANAQTDVGLCEGDTVPTYDGLFLTSSCDRLAGRVRGSLRRSYPSDLLEHAMELSPGHETLLDLACGPGRIALACAISFEHVLAVDIEPEMIAVAIPDPTVVRPCPRIDVGQSPSRSRLQFAPAGTPTSFRNAGKGT